jgi:hypothetical protein
MTRTHVQLKFNLEYTDIGRNENITLTNCTAYLNKTSNENKEIRKDNLIISQVLSHIDNNCLILIIYLLL